MFRFLSRTTFPTAPNLVSSPWLPSRLASTSSSSLSKGNSFVVSYLTGTCGFSPERAVSVSKQFSFETSEKPDLVIEFLKDHGFSQTTSLRLVRTVPFLLQANPGKTLKPKFDFLKSIGFSTSDICRIVLGCPLILGRSLKNEIIPSFDFFNDMFQSRDRLVKAVKRFSGILYDIDKISAPNIKLLREEGVPESHIVRFVEYFPRALKASPNKFKEAVQQVKELGFNPLRLQFVVAINVKIFSGRSWEKKEAIYRKWGWTDDDIFAVFRVHPWCVAISDDKIEAVMDFLVNRLGYKSADIARCPVVLSMSLGKRIIPRGSVILLLMSKELVVNQLNLTAIYKCNEKVFLRKFVSCHEKEADELLKLYQSKMALAG